MSVLTVLFDLDETLFDRSGSLHTFVCAQLSDFGYAEGDEARLWADRFLMLDGRGSVAKSEVYATMLREMGLYENRAVASLFHHYESNAWRFARPFPDMTNILEWLHSQNIKIGVVSNGQNHIQLRSILALDLDRIVDTYLISEAEGLRKPEVAIFERAAARLNTPVSACVFVGDSPVADISGARSAGMRTIWIPNGACWPEDYGWQPDATATSLGEARLVLRDWIKD